MPWRIILVVTALLLAACASEEARPASEQAQSNTPSSVQASAPEAGPSATNPWVVTFRSWGPIELFVTTADEVLAMPGWTQGHDRSYPEQACLLNTELGAEVSLSGSESPVLVSAIRTPKGTLTDRGVGNESTVEQIKSAYGGDPAITIAEGTGANGTGVMVMGRDESQLGFEYLAPNGPTVNGGYSENRCVAG